MPSAHLAGGVFYCFIFLRKKYSHFLIVFAEYGNEKKYVDKMKPVYYNCIKILNTPSIAVS